MKKPDIGKTYTTTTSTTTFVTVTGEVGDALRSLYRDIWTEACYDSDSEESREFAKKLLPHIKKLNEILEFQS